MGSKRREPHWKQKAFRNFGVSWGYSQHVQFHPDGSSEVMQVSAERFDCYVRKFS